MEELRGAHGLSSERVRANQFKEGHPPLRHAGTSSAWFHMCSLTCLHGHLLHATTARGAGGALLRRMETDIF